MRCPNCGDKIHDPGLDRFCPSCGKDIPHQSPEEKAIVRDRTVSGILLLVSLILIMLGFSFVLPDIIIHWIDPEIQTMYWPYSLIVLIVGILLLVIRHPFAKRSRKHTAVILEQAQAKWSCSYCGGDNVPGSVKCSSCGAPIKNR